MRWLQKQIVNFVRDWVLCVRHYGPVAIPAYVIEAARVRRADRLEQFDARYGTNTGGIQFPWNSTEGTMSSSVHAYQPIPAWLLRETLEAIPLRSGDFSFLDLGAGKGRALLVAAEFPFRAVTGVEISPELGRIAEQNIKRYSRSAHGCPRFAVHCADAAKYEFEPAPLVVFLHNPFGRQPMHAVIRHLERSYRRLPRDLYVIYVNPRYEALLRASLIFRRIKAGGPWWRPWHRYAVYAAASRAP